MTFKSNIHIKLSELGSAKRIINETVVPKTICDPSPYRAPEINGTVNAQTYKVDLYSFAISMCQLISKRLVVSKKSGLRKIQVETGIELNDLIWDECPEMKEILSNFLICEPKDRWGWPEVFRNEYIQQLLLKRTRRILEEQKEVFVRK